MATIVLALHASLHANICSLFITERLAQSWRLIVNREAVHTADTMQDHMKQCILV
jgi:hypothetical protein